MRLGTPLSESAVRVMLLGAGELGKEVAIELQRLGARGAHLPRRKGTLRVLAMGFHPRNQIPNCRGSHKLRLHPWYPRRIWTLRRDQLRNSAKIHTWLSDQSFDTAFNHSKYRSGV